jgi:hypothetical protein
LIVVSSILSIFLGFGVGRWYQSQAQKRRVFSLCLELGFVETSPAVSPHPRVNVWYDGDLHWDGDEERYKISYSSLDRQPKGVEAWMYCKLGRDFWESPTAVEIDCLNFGQSTITDEFIDQIRKLRSIKQIWMADRTGEKNGKGNDNRLVGPTNEDLAKLFPDLLVASPQH